MNNNNKPLAIALLCSLSAPALSLDILLTNDDSYTAPGINILYDTLVAAGHNVTLVAPKENQSGKSMSFNTDVGAAVEVVNYDAGKWFVDGTPVDCVSAGLDMILADNPPDLVVSGANFGENVGTLTHHSGTVGAALEALQRGVPGIAVSVGLNLEALQSGDPQAPLYTINAMDDAAAFTVQVIAQLEAGEPPSWCQWYPEASECQGGDGLALPDGVGININYPPKEAHEVADVAKVKVSSWTPFDLTISADENGNAVVSARQTGAPSGSQLYEDAVLLTQDYVTVSPIRANMNVDDDDFAAVSSQLGELEP